MAQLLRAKIINANWTCDTTSKRKYHSERSNCEQQHKCTSIMFTVSGKLLSYVHMSIHVILAKSNSQLTFSNKSKWSQLLLKTNSPKLWMDAAGEYFARMFQSISLLGTCALISIWFQESNPQLICWLNRKNFFVAHSLELEIKNWQGCKRFIFY